MKFFSLIVCLLFCESVWSSEVCKSQAQMAVEVREDYKNLAELKADLANQSAHLPLFSGQALINVRYNIDKLRMYGDTVFLHSSGAKGAKLYKIIYDRCVADEKITNDRAAKQAAREAAREAATKTNPVE